MKISQFANPQRFASLAKWLSPFCIWGAGLLAAAGLYFALFVSPEDYQQGQSVRILYVHVPAAWMATIAYSFMAFMSAVAYVWRHPIADYSARAAALPGAVFTALALITGALWGKPTWGAAWVWDARLTSVLVLLFLYIGYLSVWHAVEDTRRAARYARIVALVGFINIPIVKFSVEWWNSLHQPAAIIRADGPSIHPSMLWPLLLMIGAYSLLFGWLVLVKVRTDIIEQRRAPAPTRAPTGIIDEGEIEADVSSATAGEGLGAQ